MNYNKSESKAVCPNSLIHHFYCHLTLISVYTQSISIHYYKRNQCSRILMTSGLFTVKHAYNKVTGMSDFASL